jgi:Lipid A 3-O-deacylase (PagL)
VSTDAGCEVGADGARRGAVRRRAARFGAVRFALRLADRFADFFFDDCLLEALRDFAAVFAAFRRFLAMRAPPVEVGARILSDKLIARVLILWLILSMLLSVVAVAPATADQAGAVETVPEPRMPFERGTVEVSVFGGTSLPTTLFRSNPDHQLVMASFAIGRVMAGGPGKGNLELLVDVTPFFQVRQPDLVRGWSVAPLFVRWNFPAIGDGAVRVFGEVSGSLLFTAAPVPVRTTTFNFMDQAGFGIRFEESRGRAWLVGYRFQHISNAGRVKPNPGANFNFVYLGLSFLR